MRIVVAWLGVGFCYFEFFCFFGNDLFVCLWDRILLWLHAGLKEIVSYCHFPKCWDYPGPPGLAKTDIESTVNILCGVYIESAIKQAGRQMKL